VGPNPHPQSQKEFKHPDMGIIIVWYHQIAVIEMTICRREAKPTFAQAGKPVSPFDFKNLIAVKK
jgi:hypothetical protein